MPAPVIPLILSAAQTAAGLINRGKAKKEAKLLEESRPNYEVNQLYQDDLDLAESELAGGGISSRAETAYNNLNNQQFSSSLDAILKSGGSANNVAEVFSAGEEGRQRLALLNDQARVGQIDRLVRARGMMSEQQDKAFEFNEWRPWADKAQANSAARQGADGQIWSGLQSAGAAGMQYLDQQNQDKQFQQYLQTLSGGNNQASSTGGIPQTVGVNYDMNTGNQLQNNSPTFNPGINPNGNQNQWNWYNPNG